MKQMGIFFLGNQLKQRPATLLGFEAVLIRSAAFAEYFADAHIAGFGDIDPDAITFRQHGECLGVPGCTATGDEAVAACQLPGAIVAEGDVELAVPRLLLRRA